MDGVETDAESESDEGRISFKESKDVSEESVRQSLANCDDTIDEKEGVGLLGDDEKSQLE